MSWLSACGMVISELVIGVCLNVVEYSRADQTRAADQIVLLPDDAILIEWLADYSAFREQVKACNR